jgi:uncharacterized protein involved in exopolysaccharide biosynthesis
MEQVSNSSYSDQDIDVRELINVLWSQKIAISLITFIFAITSIFYALSLQDKYTSQTVLELAGQDAQMSSGGGASSFGGLASVAGISLSSSSNQAVLAIKTIQSRDFLEHLLTFEGMLSNLIGIEAYDKNSGKVTYKDQYAPEDIINLPTPLFQDLHNSYRSMVNLSEDPKSGLINLSVTSKSPNVAYEISLLILKEINNVYRAEALEESSKALSYLKQQLASTPQNEVRRSMSQVIESQLKTQMFANIREDYLLKPFDNAFIPDIKSGPARSIICVVITLFGFFFSIIYSLAVHFYKKNK